MLEVCQNNQSPSCVNNNDEDTDFETAMSGINGVMPAPGTGGAGASAPRRAPASLRPSCDVLRSATNDELFGTDDHEEERHRLADGPALLAPAGNDPSEGHRADGARQE